MLPHVPTIENIFLFHVVSCFCYSKLFIIIIIISGFKYMFDDKLVTVWSAPNYCYRCGNIASILEFTNIDTKEPKLFQAVPDSERVIPPRTTTPYFL